MEVENVGNNPLNETEDKNSKRFWTIIFSVVGVTIVGVIIAIVVILIIRQNASNSEVVDEPVDEEAYTEFLNTMDDIEEKNATGEYSREQMLDMYKQKIEEAKDEKTKALIEIEYYKILAMVSSDDVEDDVMYGLRMADRVLETASSAFSVAYVAGFYGDEELKNQYNEIANARLKIELEEEAKSSEPEGEAEGGDKEEEVEK